MGMFDWITRRKSVAAGAMVMYRTGQAAPHITNPESLAKKAYAQNSDVLSAITQYTTAAKGIEIGLLRVSTRAQQSGWTPQRVRSVLATAGQLGGHKGYVTKERLLIKERVLVPVDAHPLLDLLANPNPLQDWSMFIESILGSYKLAGNSFMHMVGPDDPRKPPMELWPLMPHLTKIIIGDRENPIREYRYGQGEGERIDPAQVIHFKTWHPTNPYYGLPPLLAAAKRIDWSNSAEDWNLSLMRNGGQRAGAVKVQTRLTPDQRKDLNDWIDDEYMGTGNVGRPLLLEGGVEWQDLAMTPQEAAWLAGSEASTRKIAQVLRWPAILLGDSSDRTYSNYKEARRAAYQEGVLPDLDMVRNQLNRLLVPRYGTDLLLTINTADIEALQEDKNQEWQRIDAASELTIDEKREAKGYPPLPGGVGQVVLVPFSMAPLRPYDDSPDDLQQIIDGDVADDEQTKTALPASSKAWGLQTYDAKTQWWKAVEAQREQIAERVTESVKRRFRAEARAISDAMEASGSPVAATIAAERALDAQQTEWIDLLRQTYLQVSEVFALQVLRALTKNTAPSLQRADGDDLWQRYAQEWIGANVAQKVTKIMDTTRVQLRSVLAQGIADGDSIYDLSKRVRDLGTQFTAYRSNLIARHETVTASNMGQWAGAKSTGLNVAREWVATRDDRVRDAHADADTQTVGMDDPYEVDGEPMMFPADDSLGASPGNVIQCRCTEVYTVVD